MTAKQPPEKPRNPVIRQLNRSLDLPPSTLGQLDWTTGILRINATGDRWKAWRAAPTSDRPLFATLMHEAQHAIQVAACTKLYKGSLLLYGLVTHLDATYPDAALLPASLDNVGLSADSLNMMRTAIWDLNYKGDGEVTVLEILEGLTHLTEQRLSRQYDTASYLAYIPTARVDSVYTNAFVRFHELSGRHPQSIWFFPPACHLALCSETPQQSFCAIAAALKSGRLTAQSSLPDIRSVCQEHDRDFLGWSWEWRSKHRELVHPLFEHLHGALRQARSDGSFDKYVLRPDRDDDLCMSALRQPTILNPAQDSAAPGFREWPMIVWHWDGNPDMEEKKRRMRKLTKLVTIARRYMGDFGNPPPDVMRQRIA